MIINHLGISGGKDSTALLLWAVHESGYDPASLDVTFCDTGNEAPETLDYVRMLSDRVHPIKWLTPKLGFWELAKKRQMFPTAKMRFCTVELKLVPTRAYINGLLSEGHDVLAHVGIRAGESLERRHLAERSVDGFSGVPVYRPLLRWSLADIWAIHERYGVPRNPLYDLGAERVGCFPCVMSKKHELNRLAQFRPERVLQMAAMEQEVNDCKVNPNFRASFFHHGKVPVSQRTHTVTRDDGKVQSYATVEDVFRWAKTARGGNQYVLDLDEDRGTCPSESGACE